MFQYISDDPIICSRYHYAELKCKNDKWSKSEIPKWYNKLKEKIVKEKKELIEKIMYQVKEKLPELSIINKSKVRRFHSFLRVSYDFLFQGKWDVKAKFMNIYDSNIPLINQLTYPQLYFIYKITIIIEDKNILEKLNIESLKYRKKQKYKKSMKTIEWISKDPYDPKVFILN